MVAELSPPESARRYWFAPDGRWWGLTPGERLGFLEWESALES